MADFDLVLGDFTFEGFEVPDNIPFPGEQRTTDHDLPGGVRVTDAMGYFAEPLTWSGRFRGPDALERCLYLQSFFKDGSALALTWSELSFTVLPKRFDPDFTKRFEIPYTLTLTVIEDLTAPLTPDTGADVDDMVDGDMDSAEGQADGIDDDDLTDDIDDLNTAVSDVPSFASASRAAINTVLGPLGVAQGRVGDLIDTVGAVIDNASVGGVVVGAAPADMALSLLEQVAAATQLPRLYDLQSTLGRMATNLGNVTSSGEQRVTVGGNLYDMAAEEYGDSAEWATIARANDILDPVLTGVQTITIPPTAGDTGGVLQP